jgi:hypothetical protein
MARLRPSNPAYIPQRSKKYMWLISHRFFTLRYLLVEILTFFEQNPDWRTRRAHGGSELNRTLSPRRSPSLSLRRKPRRNFPLQFFFCAPLKKSKKEREISARFRPWSFWVVRRGFHARTDRHSSPNPLLPSRPRFGQRVGGYLQ